VKVNRDWDRPYGKIKPAQPKRAVPVLFGMAGGSFQ